MEREVERLNLAALLTEVAAQMRPLADAAGLAMTLDLPDSLPSIDGSRDELSRLFTNLISNAIKYNRPGGSVEITARADGAYLRATVRDTGIGIPADALPRLFTDFYRVKTPETRLITGTGLGLAIVKRIAAAHQGSVTVESQPGRPAPRPAGRSGLAAGRPGGSAFTVRLPVPVPAN